MKVYAQFGPDGRKTGGFWDDSFSPDIVIMEPSPDQPGELVEVSRVRNPDIPADAIEITEEDRFKYLAAYDAWVWDFDKKALVSAEPLPIPLPETGDFSLGISIRDWQFFSMLALEGVITHEEALATSSGDLPKLLTDAIAAAVTDPQARLIATMKVRNTTNFYRHDPMVALVAAYLTNLGTFGVWDAARLDALWVAAGKLA